MSKLGNQNHCKIIHTCKVGYMSPAWRFRNGDRGAFWVRALLVSVALSSVLVARNVPPRFPRTLGVHSAISPDAHHDQRPRFDNNGSQWGTVADSFLPAPPVVESAPLTPLPHLFTTLQSKGFHFNRPPPVS